MAKNQIVSYSYTCDVCGATIDDGGEDSTRTVRWEGADYVVDVCPSHSSQLTAVVDQLREFAEAGHRASARNGGRAATGPATRAALGRRSSGAKPSAAKGATSKRSDLPAVRSWAQATGRKVGVRGRIPADILAAYDADQAAPAEPKAPRKRRPRRVASAAT
jgi:hypothetical protein